MGWVTTVLVSASCGRPAMFRVTTALRPCSRITRANSSEGSDRCCGSVPCPYSTAGILPARRVRRAAPLPNSVRVSASIRSSATVVLLVVSLDAGATTDRRDRPRRSRQAARPTRPRRRTPQFTWWSRQPLPAGRQPLLKPPSIVGSSAIHRCRNCPYMRGHNVRPAPGTSRWSISGLGCNALGSFGDTLRSARDRSELDGPAVPPCFTARPAPGTGGCRTVSPCNGTSCDRSYGR